MSSKSLVKLVAFGQIRKGSSESRVSHATNFTNDFEDIVVNLYSRPHGNIVTSLQNREYLIVLRHEQAALGDGGN